MHEVTHTRRPDGSRLDLDGMPDPARHGASGEVVRVEDDVFLNRDGRQVPVAYTASPIETAEGVQGCVVVFEDISERKAREETLQARS